MQKISNLVIHGSKEKPILLDIFYNVGEHLKPIVIFCHGFKGFKDWGHFNLVAEEFAREGFVFVKFNFSYNGTTTEQPSHFADLNAFGENNFSIELNDLGLVIDFIEENANAYSGDAEKIYLIGHSRGGGISILKTGEDVRIKKLVTWASVKDLSDFFAGQDMEDWEKKDILYTHNSRTQQDMPLRYQLYDNYMNNKVRLNISEVASEISVPWLIIHGRNDESVPYFAAEQLHEWNKESELLLLDDADHTFGGKHPWTEDQLPDDAKSAVEKSISFFKK
jgi:dienelactone hydrolase